MLGHQPAISTVYQPALSSPMWPPHGSPLHRRAQIIAAPQSLTSCHSTIYVLPPAMQLKFLSTTLLANRTSCFSAVFQRNQQQSQQTSASFYTDTDAALLPPSQRANRQPANLNQLNHKWLNHHLMLTTAKRTRKRRCEVELLREDEEESCLLLSPLYRKISSPSPTSITPSWSPRTVMFVHILASPTPLPRSPSSQLHHLRCH
jgi:hypothetical protein